MPIIFPEHIKQLNQEQFHAIDKAVIAIAFDVHNSLGRLFSESVYQAAMRDRALAKGMTCQRESRIQLTHKGFKKSYYMDLVIDGVIYETKTESALSTQPDAQLLNYLMLTDSSHAKLINFRPNSVEYKFLSTQLSTHKRQQFKVEATDPIIQSTLTDLLSDWGTHLKVSLYSEALYHLLDYSENKVQIIDRTNLVGHQDIHCSPDNKGLIVTGISKESSFQNYQIHLDRLLSTTNLSGFHWINFNQSHIVQTTLEK